MSASAYMSDIEMRRLSWRCRRGLLELDIVLQRFADQHLASLDANELAVFNQLLDYPDNEFLDVVTARVELKKNPALEALKPQAMQRLLTKLRTHSIR